MNITQGAPNQRFIDAPITEGIILKRYEAHRPGAIETNVPRRVVEHSPNGFEIGYRGSGPSDTALNVAETVLRKEGWDDEPMERVHKGSCCRRAWKAHQHVKERFIATLPEEGGTLDYEEVRQYIAKVLGIGKE